MPYQPEQSWASWSPERIRDEQGKRLRRFIREQVVPFSPLYSRLFKENGIDPNSIKSVDDLQKIPFVSKEEIAPSRANPDLPRDLVLQPNADLIKEHWGLNRKLPLLARKIFKGQDAVLQHLACDYRPVNVFFTTGRSALPTAFTLSRYDLDLLQEVGRRILEVAKVDSAGDRLLNIFPFAPHLAFWQVYYAGIGGTVFTLNTGGGKVMGTAAILQAITKIRPAFLIGIPGYIYHLLREAHENSLDLSFVKGIAVGGDQATGGYRQRVKDMLCSMGAKNPRVQSVLGFTEARKCWAECPGEEAAGFHTYPDLEIMELVDPETGKPVGEGETGELVYTCLDGRGSCVLRYRTGDLIIGGMTMEACPHCGRSVPRLASRLERVSNMKSFQLSKVKGTLVNLNVFKTELESNLAIEEWQLVIRKRNDDPFDVDEIHLNVSLSTRVEEGARDGVISEIEQRLFQLSEVRLNSVRQLPLKELLDLLGMETQLKEKRIVDLRVQGASPESKRSGASDAVENVSR
jgi:phenylacetate-CoA ligase